MILIYQNYIHNLMMLYESIASVIGRQNVDFIDADQLINEGKLTSQVKALVMPGGADLYYCEKLNGQGNHVIRNYVEAGGTYLGICAGAYYGCSEIGWMENTADEIAGQRELAFFPGKSTGPISQFTPDYTAQETAVVEIKDAAGKTYSVCYWGGPQFVAPYPDDVEVMARYTALENSNAALIKRNIGTGQAILSSSHLEISANLLALRGYELDNSTPTKEDLQKLRDGGQPQLWLTLLQDIIT